MGFRFYSVMPLHDDVVTTALGGASPMAEYVETHLELSLAKDAREKREAPATRAALYTSAINRLVAKAGGGGAGAGLARDMLSGVDLRALRRLAAHVHKAKATEISREDVRVALDGDVRKVTAVWWLGRSGELLPLTPRGDALVCKPLAPGALGGGGARCRGAVRRRGQARRSVVGRRAADGVGTRRRGRARESNRQA